MGKREEQIIDAAIADGENLIALSKELDSDVQAFFATLLPAPITARLNEIAQRNAKPGTKPKIKDTITIGEYISGIRLLDQDRIGGSYFTDKDADEHLELPRPRDLKAHLQFAEALDALFGGKRLNIERTTRAEAYCLLEQLKQGLAYLQTNLKQGPVTSEALRFIDGELGRVIEAHFGIAVTH